MDWGWLTRYRYVPTVFMLVLSLALLYMVLFAPFEYVLHPRFDTITYAVAVYGWGDLRVTFLEVLLMLAVLLTTLASAKERAFRFVVYSSLAFSAFNFILPIVIDYGVNLSSQSPFPGFWARAASYAYQVMISTRVMVDLPRQAGIWLATMSSVFALTRIKQGVKTAFADSLWLAFAILSAFAVGSHVIDPNWALTYVTLLQVGTSFQWFTNEDLLLVSLLGLAFFSAARVLLDRRSGF